jgi:hypothetical protein
VVSRRKGKIVVYETFRDSSAFSVCGFVVSDTNAFVLTDTNTIVMTDTNTIVMTDTKDRWFSLNSACGSVLSENLLWFFLDITPNGGAD